MVRDCLFSEGGRSLSPPLSLSLGLQTFENLLELSSSQFSGSSRELSTGQGFPGTSPAISSAIILCLWTVDTPGRICKSNHHASGESLALSHASSQYHCQCATP